MCPHLHCVRILAQRLQPNHKIVDPCVMKNAARGICPKLGKLQEDLFIVHFQSLRYLIGLIWANRIALRESWGSIEIPLQGVAVICVRFGDLAHSRSANNFPTVTGFGPNR